MACPHPNNYPNWWGICGNFHNQYAALDIAEQMQKKQKTNESFTDLLVYMITTRSWWDTVDATHKMVGIQMQRYPQQLNTYTLDWIESRNIWLIRMAIIFQLSYKRNTDKHTTKIFLCKKP